MERRGGGKGPKPCSAHLEWLLRPPAGLRTQTVATLPHGIHVLIDLGRLALPRAMLITLSARSLLLKAR